MPSFFSMRSLPDDLPPLGERLPRPDEQPAADLPEVEVSPGILRNPKTGRLRTDLPTEADKHFPAAPTSRASHPKDLWTPNPQLFFVPVNYDFNALAWKIVGVTERDGIRMWLLRRRAD